MCSSQVEHTSSHHKDTEKNRRSLPANVSSSRLGSRPDPMGRMDPTKEQRDQEKIRSEKEHVRQDPLGRLDPSRFNEQLRTEKKRR